jgi:hypothetical protein
LLGRGGDAEAAGAAYGRALDVLLRTPILYDRYGRSLVREWVGLAGRQDAVRRQLEERFDALESRLRSGPVEETDLCAFHDLAVCLRRTRQVVRLLDRKQTLKVDAETRARWMELTLEALVDQERYDEIVRVLDVAEVARRLLHRAEAEQPFRESYESESGWTRERDLWGTTLAARIYPCYQTLVAREPEEAQPIGDKLVELYPNGNVCHALALCGYRTGRPTEACLGYARRADEMYAGSQPAYVATIARILAARGEQLAALRLLNERAKQAKDPRVARIYQECYDELAAKKKPRRRRD